jgi:DNA-binding CsgD family transcriptional regulator
MSTHETPQFNQCDHCALELLHFHLMQAEESGIEYSQIQKLVEKFRGVLDDSSFISIYKDGTVQFITPQAEARLKKYFPSQADGTSLPPNLQKWFDYQVSELVLDGGVDYPMAVLNIEQDMQQLTIHFIADQGRNYYVLLLEEKKSAIFSVADLELLGLSRRRAEALFWIARDKSNAEIAKILACSEGTVRKHVEFIHKQLNVHTRAGAVIAALERLGMLKY